MKYQAVKCDPLYLQCYLADKYLSYDSITTSPTRLAVLEKDLIEKNNTLDTFREEKIRMNFRDFFSYAIKTPLRDPIKAGACSSDCF